MYALNRDNHQINEKRLPIYNVGIYTRLSREDENVAESESIANQREYLMRYVLEQGWNLVDVFVDDGYTGTNFNRPDFLRLLSFIEDKKVNLVITKDLSRLGRDYIETGHYIERYFPTHGVRYIALNDGVDTFDKHSSNNDMSPFKSVMNDFYARDISKKVRTSLDTKRIDGKFIGAFAPYGYLKDPLDKHHLIVDHETAPVVRYIYDMYLSGNGYTLIAHSLNDAGIPSPSVYKKHSKRYMIGLWSLQAVRLILLNPTYAGHLAQHKYKKVSYKVKQLKAVKRGEWIITENTHEAIVLPEVFERVQKLMDCKVYTGGASEKRKAHLFSGLLYCADCGSRMTYTKTQKGEWYCICSRYKHFKQCSRHSYHEESLEEYIMNDLKRLTAEARVEPEEFLDEARKKTNRQKQHKIDTTQQAIESSKKRLEEITRTIKTLYEDKLKGILTEQDFINLSGDYNSERTKLTEKLNTLTSKKAPEPKTLDDELLETIRSCLVEYNKVPKAVLAQLIRKIEIAEGKKLTIHYNFTAPHDARIPLSV